MTSQEGRQVSPLGEVGATRSAADSRTIGGEPVRRPIVTAVPRARRWQEMLDTGEVGSLTALAEKMNADRSYVARILRLNLLAPDIVEAILDGREPRGLSLAKLTQTLPILWHEQSELFGFQAV